MARAPLSQESSTQEASLPLFPEPPSDLSSTLASDLASTPSSSPLASVKFETALAELESLVLRMENGNLPLEESIDAYRRGTELLRHCRAQLSAAEHKIQILEQGDLADLADFDPAKGGNP